MDNCLVSVIVTTFGDPSTLKRAIISVLDQEYSNIELIVVDDNGDDGEYRLGTAEVMSCFAREERVTYLRHRRNMNGSAARNTGIKHASGRYLTFLDNDDFMLRGRLSNAVRALEESDADACFCDVLFMRGGYFSGVLSQRKRKLNWKDLLFDSGCMGTGSNLFLRHTSVLETGQFDTSFRRNQDIEYMLRFLYRHDSVWVNSLDLVKSESATSNAQTLANFILTKQHLEKTFTNLLSELDERERQAWLIGKEKELLSVSICNGDRGAAVQSLNNLRQLGYPVDKTAELKVMLRCRQDSLTALAKLIARVVRHRMISRNIASPMRAEIVSLENKAKSSLPHS